MRNIRGNEDIKQGSVIGVCLDGERGRQVPRPDVVLSMFGNNVSVVVCTAHPNSKERVVEIPSAPNGNISTKLRQKTWAVINWRGEISSDNVTESRGGFVKGNCFQKIVNEIKIAEANSEIASLNFAEWLKYQ